MRSVKIAPNGSFTEIDLSHPYRFPREITSGREGDLWFTDGATTHNIGRLTPGGVFSEFPLFGESAAYGITAGREGDVWFTFGRKLPPEHQYEEPEEGDIGRIPPSGKFSEFPLPPNQFALGITTGPVGDLWFTDGSSIDRITPSGRITEFPLPAGGYTARITAGSEGNLWFTESKPEFKYAIGRITPERLTIENPMRVRLRNGWVKLKLSCGGGNAGRACRGTLRLSMGSTLLAHGIYRISPEADSSVSLHLTPHELDRLSRHHRLPVQETATLSGGEGASGEVVLHR